TCGSPYYSWRYYNYLIMSTLVVYPDAGHGSSSVDGSAYRGSVDETFANIIAGAGTGRQYSNASNALVRLQASTTTNQFQTNIRSIFTFVTSSLTSAATISDVSLSLYGSDKGLGVGSPNLHVVASTPASDYDVVNGDYSQLGSTSFGSVTYANFSTSGYNDITLNSSGIANVSKTGVSKFGAKFSWDLDGTFGGTWSSGAYSYLRGYYADQTGTTNDPKLTITYTTVVGPANLKSINGLASASIKSVNGLAMASIKSFNGVT
ncbi:MAG: hypothetical protein PHN31_01635, partial [Candidatus Gracilibacteria bacterium]|nr:hypothetical protein [Candidatus Gracilibacteria bacterium]